MPQVADGAGGADQPNVPQPGDNHGDNVTGNVKPRGMANPTPPVGAQVKQNLYEASDQVRQVWHEVKVKVMKAIPEVIIQKLHMLSTWL